MAQLLSVNVGLPRDIEWNGKTVRTAVWKQHAQVVGVQASDVRTRSAEQKVLIDGCTVRVAADDGIVFVAQTVGIRIIRIEVTGIFERARRRVASKHVGIPTLDCSECYC